MILQGCLWIPPLPHITILVCCISRSNVYFQHNFCSIDIFFHLISLTQLPWIRTVICIFFIQEFINHVGHPVVDSLQSSFPQVICSTQHHVVSSWCLLHVLQNLFRSLCMYLFYSLCLVKCCKVIG